MNLHFYCKAVVELKFSALQIEAQMEYKMLPIPNISVNM